MMIKVNLLSRYDVEPKMNYKRMLKAGATAFLNGVKITKHLENSIVHIFYINP